MNTTEHDCQDLAATGLKSYTVLSRLGMTSLELLHCCNSIVPKSWQWLQHSRLGFPSLDTFWVKDFPYETFSKTDFFHDLVFQDMNTIGFVFKPWQPPQFWFFFVQDLAYLQLHVPKSWQWLQYFGANNLNTKYSVMKKTWQSHVWFFHDLAWQAWNCYIFCNSMFQTLENDCTIQDYPFQVLTLVGIKKTTNQH